MQEENSLHRLHKSKFEPELPKEYIDVDQKISEDGDKCDGSEDDNITDGGEDRGDDSNESESKEDEDDINLSQRLPDNDKKDSEGNIFSVLESLYMCMWVNH